MSDLQRHLALLGVGARNVRRRWRRSLAVAVPLAMAMAIATTTALVADGIRRDAAAAAATAPDLAFQRVERGRLTPFAQAPVEESLRQQVAVEDVRSRVFTLVPAPGDDGDAALATLIGVDFSAAGEAPKGTVEGRLPGADETGVVVLGRGLAAQGRMFVGAQWRVPGQEGARKLEVVGIFDDGVSVHAANLALTSLADARAIAGVAAGETTEIAVTLRDQAAAREVAEAVVTRFPELRVVGRESVARILDVIYGSRSGPFVAIWLILLLVAPAVAWALGMDVAASERHEMGVLKALGWSTLGLVEARLYEGAILGVFATLAGAAMGLGLALAGAPGLRELFTGWAEVYPDFALPLWLEPGSALALFTLGTVPLLAASAVPAWRVGSLPPDDVMRE